ncbi:lipoprotein insertase outer membrane protein LolB [Candidatus Parabeggiatoa sp. HSG14]|uniref:lipoprotein insertase outer membrane protein LolB n=1 Tax=Candidatus Parabeggiatoa sp. HSG14 TaxID=3055593 RepID=UPI0025A889FB|nr:lipoprotein insertase outer membrane protein LolB [Thiotrichales bacterium HSG14]
MKYLLLLALPALLLSCASLPSLPPNNANQLDSWHLKGRIAIVTEDDSWTANVHWQQQGTDYQLRLNTPLGQGVLLLEGNDISVVMHTANNETFRAHNPDALVAQVLKLEIPVTGLHFWIRGLPSPKTIPTRYVLTKTGYLKSLQQDGWEIEYGRYLNVDGINLPRKIFLDNNQFQVKIVISQWNIKNPTL